MTDDSSDRIVAAVRRWLAEAPPGARLPSTRQLVAEHAASPVTVQKALRALAVAGAIESRPGVGNFVRESRAVRSTDHGWQTAALGAPRAVLPRIAGALRAAPEDAQALHSGYPEPGLLPARLVRTALTRATRGGAATTRPPAAGLWELRAWFAAEIAGATPADHPAPTGNDVIITPGSQSALTSAFRALVPPGHPLLVESPTYWGAILAAHQAGVHLVPVASDAEGPVPAQLDRALRETGARAIYVQPTYANPTGAQWSARRSIDVLELARHHGAFLVEDDWAHDFAIDTEPRPLAALDPTGHVVYVRSLTKSTSPSLRVGAIAARGPVLDRLLADRAAESLYTSAVLQQAALEVVTDPGWRSHRRRLRSQLRERRDLLARSIRDHAPSLTVDHLPAGGLHLWARLPDGTDLDRLVRACEDRGVWVASGDEWFPTEPAAPYLRLNFTGPDPASFPTAAASIQAAV
ncbi:PLP-dependent aminotransferase family protein [Nocardioides dongkuii]|uniref:aminotransferase-like domain-containing protein n=1 Tax=Nocardioides dongkuii TaxID=2760089 RepID=UPI0015F7CAF5|nr:PLP-dependent aminotransferase family protein [Nocardioides dongkuii]